MNIGLHLSGGMLRSLGDPIALGIVLGLVVGKPIGISLFSMAAVRLRIAALPAGVRWAQLLVASTLGGIALTDGNLHCDPRVQVGGDSNPAKAAILLASLVSTLVGSAILVG